MERENFLKKKQIPVQCMQMQKEYRSTDGREEAHRSADGGECRWMIVLRF